MFVGEYVTEQYYAGETVVLSRAKNKKSFGTYNITE